MKRYLLAATLCVCAALLLLPAAAVGAGFSPGSPGTGDPMYPLAGNGGYDVSHYFLKLAYQPEGNHLVGARRRSARRPRRTSRASTSTCAASP